MVFGAGGELIISGAAGIVEELVLTSEGTVRLADANALNNLRFNKEIQGQLIIDEDFVWGATEENASGDLLLNGTLVLNAILTVAGDVSMPSYPSLLTHESERVGAINVGGTLSVGIGALIDVSEKGLPAGRSINGITGQEESVAVDYSHCGGSHGGLGGCNSESLQPETYGDARSPTRPGGGGIVNGYRR